MWIYSKIINQPMHPQNIPLNLLGNVSLTEDLEDIYKKNALGVESIFDIARKNNISVIEDCCHTLISTYNNKPIGSFGVGAFVPLIFRRLCGF